MKASNVLKRQMSLSGTARVIDVPNTMKPTTKSLRKLELEIASQVASNENMRYNSFIKANSYK